MIFGLSAWEGTEGENMDTICPQCCKKKSRDGVWIETHLERVMKGGRLVALRGGDICIEGNMLKQIAHDFCPECGAAAIAEARKIRKEGKLVHFITGHKRQSEISQQAIA